MEENNNKTIYIWLTIILLSIIWGSSFFLIKKSLLAMSPYEVGAMRVLITGLSLSPALWMFRKEIEWNRWPMFLLIALTGSAIPFVLFPLAETHINSSLAGVLNSLTPLFTLIISVALFKNSTTRNHYIGVVIGFVGAVFLVAFNEGEGDSHVFYALIVVVASILYGLNANLVKQYFQDTKAIIVTSFSFALLVPMALVYVLKMGTVTTLVNHDQGMMSFISVLVLALVGTSLSTYIFFNLLQKTDAIFGASVAYMIPIVAILLGVFDGEVFRLNHIVGTVFILIALKVISKKSVK